MQINLNMTHPHMIKEYSESEVTLQSSTYNQNLIITNDDVRILDNNSSKPSELTYQALNDLLFGNVLLIGHNDPTFLHHISLQQALLQHKGMGLEIMNIGSACRTFNILLSEERPTSLIVIF